MNTSYETELLTEQDIARAAALLVQGELVAFPTETVYGLGARIFCAEAIQKIFKAKGRPSDNPLIAHISELSQVERIAQNIPEDFFVLASAFFPGPLTIVLEKTEQVPSSVSAGLPTIALRMPSHPLARALIAKVGEPLVAPSANISGKPSATSSGHVLDDFTGKIAAVVEGGQCHIGIESTVLSLITAVPTILRPGFITQRQIEKVLGKQVENASLAKGYKGAVASPGMKYRHYAPDARVRLFTEEQDLAQYVQASAHTKKLILSHSEVGCVYNEDYAALSTASLYAAFRRADREGYDEVLVYCDSNVQSDVALMNRLIKAAES